jgi:hypothetical protein
MKQRIRFQGKEWLLVGGEKDGAITTDELYRNGQCSYAHLLETGDVKRYSEVIGTLADIEFLGEVQVEVDPLTFLGGCVSDPKWDGPS